MLQSTLLTGILSSGLMCCSVGEEMGALLPKLFLLLDMFLFAVVAPKVSIERNCRPSGFFDNSVQKSL